MWCRTRARSPATAAAYMSFQSPADIGYLLRIALGRHPSSAAPSLHGAQCAPLLPLPMTALHLLWHDAHLVAVYKPPGWLVHRTGLDAGETRFVVQTLRAQLGQHVYSAH